MAIRNDWGDTVTAQEIFDHAVAHMQSQNQRCMTGDSCSYRGADPGSACALGALLTDAEAERIAAAGGNSAGSRTLLNKGLVPDRLRPHIDLCSRLQRVHDTNCTRPLTSDAVEELRILAQCHGLSYIPEAPAA